MQRMLLVATYISSEDGRVIPAGITARKRGTNTRASAPPTFPRSRTGRRGNISGRVRVLQCVTPFVSAKRGTWGTDPIAAARRR